ncbi:MAG: hypothetical protein JNK21_11515 [Rhodospirillaceae bacterium]|nr:hypothetical protein [Rhodospirillaceae bacterium]
MSAQTSLDGLLQKGRTWLEENLGQSQQLQPLLAGVTGILLISLLVAMFGWSQASAKRLQTARTELARLEMQINEGSWSERKTQTDTLLFGLRERLWTAETAGLAEAGLERWLRDRIEKAGLRADSIRIQRAALTTNTDNKDKPSALSGLQRMTAKVVMSFEPEAAVKLLTEAATSDKTMVVDRLLIRGGRNALIEMDVTTILSLPEASR